MSNFAAVKSKGILYFEGDQFREEIDLTVVDTGTNCFCMMSTPEKSFPSNTTPPFDFAGSGVK